MLCWRQLNVYYDIMAFIKFLYKIKENRHTQKYAMCNTISTLSIYITYRRQIVKTSVLQETGKINDEVTTEAYCHICTKHTGLSLFKLWTTLKCLHTVKHLWTRYSSSVNRTEQNKYFMCDPLILKGGQERGKKKYVGSLTSEHRKRAATNLIRNVHKTNTLKHQCPHQCNEWDAHSKAIPQPLINSKD